MFFSFSSFQKDRFEILKALSIKVPMLKNGISDQEFESIAKKTSGFSGADLQALLYTSQLRRIQSK